VPEFANVPRNVRQLIKEIGFLDELDNEGMEEIYDRFRKGRCMTCTAVLGKDTLLFVNRYGLVSAYCCGACAQDLAVSGWLQEQMDDIRDGVMFRAGHGDEPGDETIEDLDDE
jgi:hypothetical protein